MNAWAFSLYGPLFVSIKTEKIINQNTQSIALQLKMPGSLNVQAKLQGDIKRGLAVRNWNSMHNYLIINTQI